MPLSLNIIFIHNAAHRMTLFSQLAAWPVLVGAFRSPFTEQLRSFARQDEVLLVSLAFFLVSIFLLRVVTNERAHLRNSVGLFTFGLVLLLSSRVAGGISLHALRGALHSAGFMLGGIAVINVLGVLIFDFALGTAHVRPPRILRDLMVFLGYIGVALWLMSRSGVTLSGIITTSAVLTAVIGFSLQDTLGNIMGGLALQLEKSIGAGDWIRVGQIEGRVKEIRWRHTSIETRNWDTVIIPNGTLMKGDVTVLGRRAGYPVLHRMWVYFHVDYRYSPTEVIEAVEKALRDESIEGVAAEPMPNCITWEYKESYMTYAVRYWLNDLSIDDPTNSRVRVRAYFALKRANIPLSIPAQSLFVTAETAERDEEHFERERQRRFKALRGVELFHSMNDDELRTLASRLSVAPFTKGESMTRQGAEAHYLYVITEGSAEVVISASDGVRKTVSHLSAGDFFGEVGMMTGARRAATVVALEDTVCYRLDKESFNDILKRRPEIAEHISHVIARRAVELEAVRDDLDAEARQRRMAPAQQDIFDRIVDLFGLREEGKTTSSGS